MKTNPHHPHFLPYPLVSHFSTYWYELKAPIIITRFLRTAEEFVVSARAEQDVFLKSLRFGTVGSNGNLNTSLGPLSNTPAKQPTKQTSHEDLDEQDDDEGGEDDEDGGRGGPLGRFSSPRSRASGRSGRSTSRYTKIEVNPKSPFMQPTESLKHRSDPLPNKKTLRDLEDDYNSSLRDHKVIPVDRYLTVRQRRMRTPSDKHVPRVYQVPENNRLSLRETEMRQAGRATGSATVP